MKSYLSVLIILLTVSTSFSQTREWNSINAPAHDNCYGLLSFEIQRRPTSANSELYEARIIFTTGQFDYDFEFSFKGRKEGSWGRITVPATGRKIVELYGTYTESESINFDTERLKYLGLELEHLRGEEQYVLCGEGANEVSRRDEAKGKSKANNTSNGVQGIGEDEINDTSTENQGYQVSDVDTSEYEAEKLRKQELSEVQANSRNEETSKEENKAKFKEKQLEDAKNFIDNQNAASQKYDAALEKLGNTLTTQFTEMSNSWAKEKDFQAKISSLTNIRAVNASSIISEARSKAQQINIEYNRKKNDALNQGVSATQTLINTAENEKQVIVGAVIGTLGTIASQSNLEKSRKDAQARLENQRIGALQQIAEKIRDKFNPLVKDYANGLIYAVLESEDEYYNKQLNYTKCMVDNAYEIVLDNSSCDIPKIKKPTKKAKYTGKDYFDAYKRKAQNTLPEIKNKAPYFLELAIEADPKNAKWLYEKTLAKNIDVFERASILKKVIELGKSTNNNYIEEYKKLTFKIIELKEKEETIISDALKENENFNWSEHSDLLRVYIDYKDKSAFSKHIAIDKFGNIIIDFGNKYDFNNDALKENEELKQYNNGLIRFRQFRDGVNLYGYLNTKGEVQIEAVFVNAHHFTGKLSPVRNIDNLYWGFIDKNGDLKLPFIYKNAGSFSEGMAFVSELKKNHLKKIDAGIMKSGDLMEVYYGEENGFYINELGEKIIAGDFLKGYNFKNSITLVFGNNKKYWFLNSKGDNITNEYYDFARPFNDKGFAVIGDEKSFGLKWYIIDKSGEKQNKDGFESEPNFKNGLAIIKIGNRKNGFNIIDDTGVILTSKEYKHIYPFKDGLALAIDENGQSIFLNLLGEEIDDNDDILIKRTENEIKQIEALIDFTSIDELENSLKEIYVQVWKTADGFLVQHNNQNNNNRGFFNKQGENIIPVKYPWLTPFSNGLAVFSEIKGKYGYINLKGKIVIAPIYDSAEMHSEGIARVMLNKKMGSIDTRGGIVIPIQYQAVYPFTEGLARICDNGKCGYVNENAEIIIPLQYIMVEPFENGKAKVSLKKPKKNDYFYIDKEGKKIN